MYYSTYVTVNINVNKGGYGYRDGDRDRYMRTIKGYSNEE